jgi:hypothetical protein
MAREKTTVEELLAQARLKGLQKEPIGKRIANETSHEETTTEIQR